VHGSTVWSAHKVGHGWESLKVGMYPWGISGRNEITWYHGTIFRGRIGADLRSFTHRFRSCQIIQELD
jgi:hypothetical protein